MTRAERERKRVSPVFFFCFRFERGGQDTPAALLNWGRRARPTMLAARRAAGLAWAAGARSASTAPPTLRADVAYCADLVR